MARCDPDDLSPSAQRALESLLEARCARSRWGFPERLKQVFGGPSREMLDARIAAALVALAEPVALPHVLSHALDPAPTVRKAARYALAALVRQHATAAEERLQSLVRKRTYTGEPWDSTWHAWDPSRVANDLEGSFAIEIASLASLHANGFVREAALRHLAAQRDPLAWRFLALRAFDHVERIRDLAATALRAWTSDEVTRAACAEPALLARIWSSPHELLRVLGSELWERVSAPAHLADFVEALQHAEEPVRRVAWKQFALRRHPERRTMLALALRDPAPRIRREAAADLFAEADASETRRIALRLLEDPYLACRQDGLRRLAGCEPREAREMLERALFDAQSSQRELARHLLREHLRAEPLAFYRESLEAQASPAMREWQLRGFAEAQPLGAELSPEDAELIARFASHPSPRVRAGVVTAFGIADSGHRRAQICTALLDPSSRVRQAAVGALRRGGAAAIRLSEIEPLWGRGREVPRFVLRLLPRVGVWDRLRAAFALGSAGSPELRDEALRAWLKRAEHSGGTPPVDFARELLQEFQHARATLPTGLRAELENRFTAWGDERR